MRSVLAFCFAALACIAQAQPMGYDDARHFLSRTGFGATDAEVREVARLTRAQAIERALASARTAASQAPPAFVDEAPLPYYKFRQMEAPERMREQRKNIEQGFQLRAWWLREMLQGPSPLTERMTLFWHGHFATGQQKVRLSQLMYRQNVLLRREALGNFGTLLHAVARDPAMLVYLDNAGSRRQAPNENFAREVMELFTLGEGHYSETDIKEAARAFTGWSLDRDSLEFTYRRAWHDRGDKTVLGRSGRLDGEDVLDILLSRPETATFVSTKLWREFISPTPDAAEVERLAATFRNARYEVKPLLRALFSSPAFWSAQNRASLVKSPVDLVVGTLRTFEIRPADMRPAAAAVALLGQNPMSPPNVKGWPGGIAWIDSSTLLGRKQLMERIFRGSDAMPEAGSAMATSMPQAAAEPAGQDRRLRRAMDRGIQTYAFDWERWSAGLARETRLEALVLACPPVNGLPEGELGVEHVRHLVSDPAYQLK